MDLKHKKIINKLKFMTQSEYKEIYNCIIKKVPCNILIFGVGKDSKLWLSLNKNGKTVFLEDSKKWIRKISGKINNIDIREVKYKTIVLRAFKYLRIYKRNKSVFDIELDDDIINTFWDIIIIDGPKGDINKEREYRKPGRMIPIFLVKYVLNKNKQLINVFVHDTHREIEKRYCDKFLGKKYKLVDTLRYYKF